MDAVPSKKPNAIALRLNIPVVAPYRRLASLSDRLASAVKSVGERPFMKSGVYHFAGTSNYGNTKHGAYMCEADAKAAGDRAAMNEHHL